MGFERVTSVLQGKSSNYDTDVFTPIMDAIGAIVGKKYGGKLDDLNDVAFRVIADHVRALTFSITDGAMPGNKGRGAVVRSVLRRAFRFGYQRFHLREPFIYKLVLVPVSHMGDAFPELRTNPGRVQNVIRAEEVDFLKTIERGLEVFQRYVARTQAVASGVWTEHLPETPKEEQEDDENPKFMIPSEEIDWYHLARGAFPGEAVFKLHATSGFPPDLTRQMAEEEGLSVDMERYEALMREHEAISRGKETTGQMALNISGALPETDDRLKWNGRLCKGTVLGWLIGNDWQSQGQLLRGEVALVLDRTCFYAEQGGQVGDSGMIATGTGRFQVKDTKKLGNTVLHVGQVIEGLIEPGQSATLEVEPVRLDTMRNHTATHLLNWALRKVLGDHIEQKGSLVDAEKTRFDFSHEKPLTKEEIAEVERLVNERIYADLPVTPVVMPLAEAKKIHGVRAVFGEKYPDPVRVLLIGPSRPEEATAEHSVEFCGGTHLNHTGQAGFFKIVGQELVGKGVRRVTAVTGREAVATVQRLSSLLDSLAARFNCKPEEVPARVESMQEELKKLQVQMRKGAAGDASSAADKLLSDATEVGGVRVIVGEMPAAPMEQMRTQMDRLRQKAKSCAVLLAWVEEGKVGLLAAVTEDAVKKGLKAGDLVGAAAKAVGGKGGGRPEMAQGGGTDPSKLPDALALAKKLAADKLGG
jgi:alanyl-tRNA synthetase